MDRCTFYSPNYCGFAAELERTSESFRGNVSFVGRSRYVQQITAFQYSITVEQGRQVTMAVNQLFKTSRTMGHSRRGSRGTGGHEDEKLDGIDAAHASAVDAVDISDLDFCR